MNGDVSLCLSHHRTDPGANTILFNRNTDQYWLVVQTHLLEAVRAGRAGVGAAHHADDEADLGVPVLGVGDGAGLHDVPVTLGGSVLTLELVTALDLRSLNQQERNVRSQDHQVLP